MNLPNKKVPKDPQEIPSRSSGRFPAVYGYVPNILSILRLLGTPVILWAISQDKFFIALILFFVFSITDWLDGYLARLWQASSKFGQVLDPLADKFLLISVYLLLGLRGLIPLWLTVLVVARDILILTVGGGIMLTQKGKILLPPEMIGKISTSLQMLFIGFILMTGLAVPSIPTSSIQNILMVFFLYIVALTTILSGITYAKVAFNAFRKS